VALVIADTGTEARQDEPIQKVFSKEEIELVRVLGKLGEVTGKGWDN